MSDESEPGIIHIIRYGLPLCRFSVDTPSHWPEGHKWVFWDDQEKATCPMCIEIAPQICPPAL